MEWTAPSGMVVEHRSIRGRELVQLAETQRADGGEAALAQLVRGCITRVVEPGPYVLAQDGFPAQNSMLRGDLVGALLRFRSVSMPNGEVYSPKLRCPSCSAGFIWDIPLMELPVRRLSPESAEAVRAGRGFDATVNGLRMTFDIGTLAHDDRVRAWLRTRQGTKQTIIDQYAAQIREVEGIGRNIRSIWEWLNDMDLGMLDEVQRALEAPDCGVETLIQVTCGSCRWEWDLDLPFDGAFFSPTRAKAPRRT